MVPFPSSHPLAQLWYVLLLTYRTISRAASKMYLLCSQLMPLVCTEFVELLRCPLLKLQIPHREIQPLAQLPFRQCTNPWHL